MSMKLLQIFYRYLNIADSFVKLLGIWEHPDSSFHWLHVINSSMKKVPTKGRRNKAFVTETWRAVRTQPPEGRSQYYHGGMKDADGVTRRYVYFTM